MLKNRVVRHGFAAAVPLMNSSRNEKVETRGHGASSRTRWFSRVARTCWSLVLFGALASCSDSDGSTPGDGDEPVRSLAQAITDTDSDGLDDGWETTHFGNLSQTATGDFDSDGMTNLEEYTNSFNPTVNDAFADGDGDRYPNVFEVRSSTNPNDASSIPTPTYVVNAAGGGTHTTVSAAISAANVANGAFQIIGIAAGTYTGTSNTSVTIDSSKPKLLIIGLEGAGKTTIEGALSTWGWTIQNSSVIASLTVRKTWRAFNVNRWNAEVRFVDMLIRDNAGPSPFQVCGGIQVSDATKVHIIGSTLVDNTGQSPAGQQINIDASSSTAVNLINTVVWGQSSATMLTKPGSATLTTTYSLVKGQTLSGTGNLAGSVNPKLRPDGRLLWDSPLRGAGGTVAQSRIDVDGELRPTNSPDIGVDQFVDTDADELADKWEQDHASNLTTLTSRTQDADSDGLTNDQEYAALSKPTVADTDGDGVADGAEVSTHGTNPLATDTDEDGMPDGWEVTYGIGAVTANAFDDADGDRYPNVFEYARSTNPSDAASVPTPNYVVNAAGGGTHTTVSAAINAANVANGAYQIIGIAPGTYTGTANTNVTIASSKPKLLFIGLEGAGKTIIEGDLSAWGWQVQNSAVIASLTVQKTWEAFYVNNANAEVRFVDLLIRDNVSPLQYSGGIQVSAAAKVHIGGSTFLDNRGGLPTPQQIYVQSGATSIVNTVVWSQFSGTMLGTTSPGTVTTSYSLVKGQTLTGTGNLAGSVDPKFRSDVRLLWDSPLRGAGGTVTQSRIDMDGELRPTSAPDIGVDQFLDTDSDQLADKWELDQAGNLTTLTSRTQDADSDGLTNDQEYAAFSKPTVADTDGDGLSDGAEVTNGTNLFVTDTDGDGMPDGWEVTYGISPTIANDNEDADFDRYPNVFEYARSSNPSDAGSLPTPNYVVNAAGGGTHTTVSAAITAANVANGAYQIIGIAPGTYTGTANTTVTIASSKPKLLVIGLEGAGKTIIEGALANVGWQIQNSAVIASLTFKKTHQALQINSSSAEVRLVDLLVRDNANPNQFTHGAGVFVVAAAKVQIIGSTFLDNVNTGTAPAAHQIYFQSTAATMINTVVWGQSSGTMLAKATNATLTTNYSAVKGQTLTGTGNLAGTITPKIGPDGRLFWDSPLRGAGGTVTQSRIDLDGEPRPTSAPDIGVDQFYDSDMDELADWWELAQVGSLTTLTGRSQDADGDGLTNAQEQDLDSNPSVADTDNDGLSDGGEVANGTNLFVTDTDGDEMPDGYEVTNGLLPLVDDRFEDRDGDTYPNRFEHAYSTNPNDRLSVPSPTYVVNGAGGGTHTTVSAAIDAANVTNGAYQIIGIAPGTYTGSANSNVTIASNKPKLLIIGLQGAENTVIDGGGGWGWQIQNSAVIASLSFRKSLQAFYVSNQTAEVRFVDLLIRDNAHSGPITSGIYVHDAAKMHIVGSTLIDNTGVGASAHQVYVRVGGATITNTVIWGQASGTMLAKGPTATLTTNYSLVKGQTLTGTGNLAGATDPKFRADRYHLRSDSPLRAAGGSVAASRIDVDRELRPENARDIGIDQFNDVDVDGLPDAWEVANAGNTTTIAGASDEDNDGLSNAAELDLEANWLSSDTDRDGLNDGNEVSLGTNPLVADADELISDLNENGILDSLDAQLGYQPNQTDNDGDQVSNENEVLMCTNPVRPDTDGDGVPDNTDAFPLDPLMSTLPTSSQDTTAPTITLSSPWYAVEQ